MVAGGKTPLVVTGKSPEYTPQCLRVFTHVESIETLVPRRSLRKIEKAIGDNSTVSIVGQSVVEIESQTSATVAFGLTLVDLIIKSSTAPVAINLSEQNLLMHAIPSSHIAYIMGRNQQYMSSLEEELGVVCFVCDDREAKSVALSESDVPSSGFAPMDKFLHTKQSPRPSIIWIAILSSSLKARVGMKLKLMNAIESKMKGFYTIIGNLNFNTTPFMHYSVVGLAVDTFPIAEEELSLALGKSGANKRRVAATSNCVLEYVGRCAFMFGTLEERQMARNFLTIVLERGRQAFNHTRWENAVGVVTMEIPNDKVGIVTGKGGVGLHQIEESCMCMCFMEGHHRQPGGSTSDNLPALPPPVDRVQKISSSPSTSEVVMVILGTDENTAKASKLIRERMGIVSQKQVSLPNSNSQSLLRQTIRNGKLVTGNNPLSDLISKFPQSSDLNSFESELTEGTTVMEIPIATNLSSLLKQLEEEYSVSCACTVGGGGSADSALVVIVGPLRRRRAVELKIMSTVETKQRGYYSHRIVRDNLRVCDRIWAVKSIDFDTDTVPIAEENLSFALGQKGSIRKKLALASGCLVEYIGECAYLSGTLVERTRARDYLCWVLQQLDGEVSVLEYTNRTDLVALVVPKRAAGFVNGNKGKVLRNVEEITGTFCFIGKSMDGGATKPLFICGGPTDTNRDAAKALLEQYIKRHEGSDWQNEATEASSEMEKEILEGRLKEMGLMCNVVEPWKLEAAMTGDYKFVCQPCPGAARPDTVLVEDVANSPVLLRKVSKKKSNGGKFVNDVDSFPELGGVPKQTSVVSPRREESPKSAVSVSSPKNTVVVESPQKHVDSGIVFDYANGQVWGDWGLGPNGDPTNSKPARQSLGGVRNVSSPPPVVRAAGVWK